MKNQYVILTGAKNNAGDFLIKYRAKQLFTALRPDRQIIDYDGWKALSDNQVNEINNSRALILTGGPALQSQMYPSIYPLVRDLKRIRVPVLTMAIGWKSAVGNWGATHNYPLSPGTMELLRKIQDSGYSSSVRDYHTLNVLYSKGLNNFLMTGCTALYRVEHPDITENYPEQIRNISFSVGVSFLRGPKLAEANQKLILEISNAFPEAKLTVVFHHSIDPKYYPTTHNPNLMLLNGQLELVEWLNRHDISWLDISGSAENMINHFEQCDWHVGYRVHAHILMASLSKPTILIAEDGRGIALGKVIGGIFFDGCFKQRPGLWGKIARRLGVTETSLSASDNFPRDVINQMNYELCNDYPRSASVKSNIDRHCQVMKKFILNLP